MPPPPPLAITASLVALAAMAGCNALTGADDLEVGGDSQTKMPDSTTPGGRSATADAGPDRSNAGPPTQPIVCAGVSCGGSAPFCCQWASARPTCVASEDTCEGALLTCGGPANCRNGDVCCAMPVSNAATCLPAIGCPAAVGLLLCERDDECPASKRCTGTSMTFGHSVCE